MALYTHGKMLAHQLEQIAARTNAGLMTREQADERVQAQLAMASPDEQAEAMDILNARLQQR
ncbi:hypothetical protein ACIQU4_15510 [Streptomyces sp. NPDC090741]|uniref:hypothetical protein n=1 Tax=Streptomyces sp. NPDC090741 TaxID=3365967 RepID=UPI00381AA9EC